MIYTNVVKFGNKIKFRGYDENKKRVEWDANFQPTFYFSSEEPTEYKDIFGFYLSPVYPGNMKECKEFMDEYKDVSGFSLCGNDNYVVQYISDYYRENEYRPAEFKDLMSMYLDIETECEHAFPDIEMPRERINAITMRTKHHTVILALGEFKYDPDDDRKYICEIFDDEMEMLERFLYHWKQIDPDIIVGWNSDGFDIPYIVNRLDYLFGEKKSNELSPHGFIRPKWVDDKFGGKRLNYQIYGVASLDYMKMYQKYVMTPRESYSLDFIASVELNETKVDWKTKYSTMHEFYTKDFNWFVEYNVVDVDILWKLEEKLMLLDLHVSIAYHAKVNYEDVYSPIRTWDAIIYNHLRDQGTIVPLRLNSIQKSAQYAGAYVKEPVPGLYDNIVSYDAASLYPSLIIQHNISPNTLVTRDHVVDFNQRVRVEMQNRGISA